MKLALTLEADSVNVQALNMGRIVVDVDGVNLSELINKVSENGYLLRVVDKSDQHATSTPPPLTTLTCIRCSTAHITETDNAWLYSLSHQTNDDGESEWIHFTGSAWACQKRSVVWLSHLPDVMASVSFIWMPALNACRVYPLSTGNQEQHEIINHGNSTGYSDCVAAGQYRL